VHGVFFAHLSFAAYFASIKADLNVPGSCFSNSSSYLSQLKTSFR
jgi:hypothetical protein